MSYDIPLMEAYRLTLRERVHSAKAVAVGSPTVKHVTAYGRAVMDYWDYAPAEPEAIPTPPPTSLTSYGPCTPAVATG
jgi:hypothetical protein